MEKFMQMFETGKPVYANDRFRRLDGFLCATVKKLIFFSTKFPCSREERIRFPADYQSDCNRFLAETRRIDGDHRLTESSFRIRGKWKKGEKRGEKENYRIPVETDYIRDTRGQRGHRD